MQRLPQKLTTRPSMTRCRGHVRRLSLHRSWHSMLRSAQQPTDRGRPGFRSTMMHMRTCRIGSEPRPEFRSKVMHMRTCRIGTVLSRIRTGAWAHVVMSAKAQGKRSQDAASAHRQGHAPACSRRVVPRRQGLTAFDGSTVVQANAAPWRRAARTWREPFCWPASRQIQRFVWHTHRVGNPFCNAFRFPGKLGFYNLPSWTYLQSASE